MTFPLTKAFKAGDFDEALVYYSRSISVLKNVPAYNNRAQICWPCFETLTLFFFYLPINYLFIPVSSSYSDSSVDAMWYFVLPTVATLLSY